MHHPEFEAMIRPARLYPELWRLALGLLVVAFVYAAGTALLAVLLFAAVDPIAYFGLLQRIAQPTEPGPTLMMLATFGAMLLGPVLAAGACHYRGPGTLFGPWGEWRRGFFVTLAVVVPVFAVVMALGLASGRVVENLPLTEWLRWLPWALGLILVQITAEEVLFRGYLQQQLAARFAARWVWMGVPSALFAAGHFGAAGGGVAWLVVAATFLFALIAADLTARTGSLGAAMGLHFANNVFGILAISASGSVTGLARWVAPFALDDTAAALASLGVDAALLVILWRVLVAVLDR